MYSVAVRESSGRFSAGEFYFQQRFVLKALLHFLQREQDMRGGDLGPRGAANMGGTGIMLQCFVCCDCVLVSMDSHGCKS